MAYKVVTVPGYDARFELALEHRVTYFGRASAARLLDAQDAMIVLLSTAPFMGTLVEQDQDMPANDALRWVRVGKTKYIAVHRPHRDDKTVVLSDLFYESEDWHENLNPKASHN